MNATAGLATAMLLGSVSTVHAQDSGRGRELFATKGCYACHGYQGQGGLSGPKLAPDPIPLQALRAFVRRSGSTAMPAYSERVLSDAEISAIHAWLASQPKTRDPKTIPLLEK